MIFSEQYKIVNALFPVNATGAAKSSDWLCLKNYHHVAFIISFGVSLVGTPAITLDQATDVAGTGSKTLGFSNIWVNATAATNDVLTKTAVTSDTHSKTAVSNQVFVVEVDADSLDLDNDFNCVQVDISTPGANDTYVSIVAIAEPRYKDGTLPAIITD